MSEDLHPQDGARFLFEIENSSDAEASYQCRIFTPNECFSYQATLPVGGPATLSSQQAAPAELEKRLQNIASSVARSAKKNIADGLPPFPARILRWRGPGRG